MPTDLPEPTPSHTRTLESLLEDIRRAREDMGASRCGPVVPERLLSARQSLLRAIEAYATTFDRAEPADPVEAARRAPPAAERCPRSSNASP